MIDMTLENEYFDVDHFMFSKTLYHLTNMALVENLITLPELLTSYSGVFLTEFRHVEVFFS